LNAPPRSADAPAARTARAERGSAPRSRPSTAATIVTTTAHADAGRELTTVLSGRHSRDNLLVGLETLSTCATACRGCATVTWRFVADEADGGALRAGHRDRLEPHRNGLATASEPAPSGRPPASRPDDSSWMNGAHPTHRPRGGSERRPPPL
jgi:hypothetical protein